MYYTCIFHIPEVKIICFVSLGFDFLDFLKQSTFLTINSNKNSSNNLQICGESNEFSLEMFTLKFLTSKQMDWTIYM